MPLIWTAVLRFSTVISLLKVMQKFIKHSLLPITVFITGACVLVVEVAATRILSPFYGNTIFTVSSVISTILAALSLGYYVGGRFSDRHPSLRWFFSVILFSGLVLLVFHLIGTITLPILGYFLPISIGPLISSILLFFAPAFLLGMLSPYAVKLQSMYFPNQGVGSVAGNIFFWSTLGSIFGSLCTGFILIPFFGVDQIIIADGILLSLLGLVPLFALGGKKYLQNSLIAFILLAGISLYVLQVTHKGLLYSKDGLYEKITIYDGEFNGRPTRFFQQDRSGSGAMFLDSSDPHDLVYDYTKYYSLYKVFNPNVTNALVIGGGAYSIPKALLADLPNAVVDVSEIEPSLHGLAKEYFNVSDNPRLHNYTDDGRRFLHDSKKKYDLIFSDVYYSLFSIPAHFTTEEFFTTARERLNVNGIFIANMIGDLSRQQPSLIMSEIRTFQAVFPNSYFFAVDSPKTTQSQNIIFIGYNGDSNINVSSALSLSTDPFINSLANKLINTDRFNLAMYPILTDAYSPVEYLTGKVLGRTFNTSKKDFFDGEEIQAVIQQIVSYGPRYPTAPNRTQMQQFLLAEMNEFANEVTTQKWQHTEPKGDSYQLTNIVAHFFPEKTKRIILATHYDSQKISFKNLFNKNQPSPGANNSASGVAVLVELARLLSNASTPPNVGIDIVFFDGEEGEESQGGDFSNWKPLGSDYFVKHLDQVYGDTKPISGVVVDMVCDKDMKIPKELSSIQDTPMQTELFWSIAQKVDATIFENRTGQEIQDDHTSLNQAGIPSFLVIDYDYPFYATTKDTVDKCSPFNLKTVTQALWDYLYVNVH